MLELTDMVNQMDLTDTYRTFHPSTKDYTLYFAPLIIEYNKLNPPTDKQFINSQQGAKIVQREKITFPLNTGTAGYSYAKEKKAGVLDSKS